MFRAGYRHMRPAILTGILFGAIACFGLFFSLLFLPSNVKANGDSLSTVEQNLVSGVVQHVQGATIEKGIVRAQKRLTGEVVTASSDASGRYTLTLDSGLWMIGAYPAFDSNPRDWMWRQDPIIQYFVPDGESETKLIDFEFPYSQAVVNGYIKMPDGSTPPFDVTVSLKTKEGYGISRPASVSSGFFWRVADAGEVTLQFLPEDPNYFAPPAQTFNLQAGDNVSAGTSKLIRKNSAIHTGVEDGAGNGINGIGFVAWSADQLVSSAMSNVSGTAVISLTEGSWLIQPQVSSNQPFWYDGDPIEASVQASQSITIPNFILQSASNVISGTILRPEGGVAELDGTLWAEGGSNRFIRSAEIVSGAFSIYLPDGEFEIQTIFDHNIDSLANDPYQLTVGGADQTVEIATTQATSVVSGTVWDPREEEVVTGTVGLMTAHDGTAFEQTIVLSKTGSYALPIAPGNWSAGLELSGSSSHLPLDRTTSIVVGDATTQSVDLLVSKVDSAITGRVFAPNGDPIQNGFVYARGASELLAQLLIKAEIDSDGRYYLQLPHGSYILWAESDEGQENGWVSPAERGVSVSVKGIRPGINLEFESASATLNGILSLPGGGTLSHPAKLWATAGNGKMVTGTVTAEGAYSLPLLRDFTWEINALYETESSVYRLNQNVMIETDQSDDFSFPAAESRPMAQAIQFETDQPAKLIFNDEIEVFVPANSLPVSGTATLIATPLDYLPDRLFNRQEGTAYALELFDEYNNPVTSSYYQDVIVSFRYDGAQMEAEKRHEKHLRPAIFNTASGEWEQAVHFVIHTETKKVSLESNFLGSYVLFGGEAEKPAIYLPMIRR